jgi:pimeloyl-ACP methyl ester carboxylesterase
VIDQRIRHTLIAGTTDALTASSAAPTDLVIKRVPQDPNQLTIPTVVLHPRNDEFIPFEAVGETAARMPVSSRFVPMEFGSHVPHLRVPDEVAPS